MFVPANPRCVSPSSTTSGCVGASVSVTRGYLLAGCGLDGVEDVPVAGAAADVSLQRLADLVVGRPRIAVEQSLRAHQHPGSAIPALQCVVVRERLLQRMQLVVGRRESFDGLDLRAVGLDREQHAALDQRAVVDHRARAAVAGVAADVAAGQVEVVADEVDQEAPRLHLALVRLAVHRHGDRLARLRFHQPLSVACLTARTATISARWRRYSLDACTSDGGSRFAPRTASRTAASSVDEGCRRTGTASTQPIASRGAPFSDTAALTMHVPSAPIV